MLAAAAFVPSPTEPAPIAATSRRGRALQVPDYVDPRCAPPPPSKRAAFALLAVSPRAKNDLCTRLARRKFRAGCEVSVVSASTGADELAMGTLLAAGTMEESSYYRSMIAKDGVDEAQLDSVRQVIAYDMNGDGLQDVVALSGTDGHISWFENGGATYADGSSPFGTRGLRRRPHVDAGQLGAVAAAATLAALLGGGGARWREGRRRRRGEPPNFCGRAGKGGWACPMKSFAGRPSQLRL